MRIAILPARGGSKRIPGKNIRPFLGRPIISYPLAAAAETGLFDVIHISTDAQDVVECAAGLGARPDFLRPPALADDMTPLKPVLRWVVEEYGRRGARFSEVCLILPCSPLITAADLAGAHSLFERDPGGPPVISALRFPAPIEWALDLGQDGVLRPADPGKSEVRSQDLRTRYYDSGNFMFLSADSLFLEGGLDSRGFRPYVLAKDRGGDIDDEDDLRVAESIYRARTISPGR